jgi:hypothetical protein
MSKPADEILGKPFQLRGRGPHAYDCLGVVLWCLRRGGREIQDPLDGASIATGLEDFRSRFIELPCLAAAQEGDVVHSGADGLSEQGVAFVESQKWLVTAQKDLGVCRIRWAQLDRYQIAKAYRLKSSC